VIRVVGRKLPEDLFKPACEVRESHANYRTNLSQLEHVKPSLTRFILTNKRLVLVDALGEVCLRQPGVRSYLTQESKQPLVLGV
jgi:hypothetical protein